MLKVSAIVNTRLDSGTESQDTNLDGGDHSGR